MPQHTYEYFCLQYLYEKLQRHNLITRTVVKRLPMGPTWAFIVLAEIAASFTFSCGKRAVNPTQACGKQSVNPGR